VEIKLDSRPFDELDADAVALIAFEDEQDPRIAERLKDLFQSGEITGKKFETTLVHRPAGLKARRLLLVGGASARRSMSLKLGIAPGPHCGSSKGSR